MSSVAAQLHQIIHTCTYLSSHFLSSFLSPPPPTLSPSSFPATIGELGEA